MTQASILGPPRTGKKVLSEQEFFEQMKDCQNDTQHNPPEVEPRKEEPNLMTPTPTSALPYFIAPGRFKVGDIRPEAKGYAFYDLELPMGSWKKLILGQLLCSGDEKKFHEWAGLFTDPGRVLGATPADINYGLEVVCYLNRSRRNLNLIISNIQEDKFSIDCISPAPYHSTSVDYSTCLVKPGEGWEEGHPFNTAYGATLGGPHARISKAAAARDHSVGLFLEELLGETDPQRCKRVLEWAQGKKPARLMRFAMASGLQAIVFEEPELSEGAALAIVRNDTPRTARGLFADPKDYSRQ